MNSDNNLVLFPKTIDYYRNQLSLLLEQEHYGDALKLLQFLIESGIGDAIVQDEWQSLHALLQTMFPDGLPPQEEDEDEELSEESLLEAHVIAKREHDNGYEEQLLRLFEHRHELERQIAALDQLRFAGHPAVGSTIKRWLTGQPLPPGIQLKALQLLKHHGEKGSITIQKRGRTFVVDIQDTPLAANDYPCRLLSVPERLQQTAAYMQPELSPLAGHTWQEFLAYAYGTPLYARLLALEEEHVDAWAAALHITLLKMIQGHADGTEVRESYGITNALRPTLQKACDELRIFMYERFIGPQN